MRSDDKKKECNYTPKKRRKITSDNTQSPTEQHSPPIGLDNLPSGSLVEPNEQSFYRQNMKSATSLSMSVNAPSAYSKSTDIFHTQIAHTGRFTAEPPPMNDSATSFTAITPERDCGGHRSSLLNSFDHNLTVPFLPWSNPSFAPLPEFMTNQLEKLDPAEFPDSAVFNADLSKLLAGVMPELREKSCLTPEIYAAVYRCLAGGDPSNLSSSMREWASHHHLCTGSDVFYLILSPREAIFQAEDLKRESYRRTYCRHIDDENEQKSEKGPEMYRRETMEYADFFERVPVRDQLFDILTYAHIAHESPPTMLRRIRKLGFVHNFCLIIGLSLTLSILVVLCNLANGRTLHKPMPNVQV
ncbi:hypothetical protein C0993_004424 [Termitomyces sp. T159_Od127]|nr:hypothetical protein C0993_004424 [Termitomyces sp. T159_Od127]